MKADVQKPIQSLHSFGRHFSGGGIAALPPILFFRNALFGMTAAIILVVSLSAAQSPDTNQQYSEGKRLDLLFDRIMQSMPEGSRSMVDSARSSGTDHRHIHKSAGTGSEKLLNDEKNRTVTRMNELPDDVKAQVERAIADMQQRKEQRKAQFRESNKKHR